MDPIPEYPQGFPSPKTTIFFETQLALDIYTQFIASQPNLRLEDYNLILKPGIANQTAQLSNAK